MFCQPIEVPECCEQCPKGKPDADEWAVCVETAWQLLAEKVNLPGAWTFQRCLHVWRPCPPGRLPCGRCLEWCHVCECPEGCAATTTVTVPLPGLAASDIAAIVDGDTVTTGRKWRTARKGVGTVVALLDVDEDGGLPGPTQNVDRSLGRPDTWGIAVWVGSTPQTVVDAVGQLACDVLNRCGGDVLKLPGNAMSVREGDTTISLDPDGEPIRAVREAAAIAADRLPRFAFADRNRRSGRLGVWDTPTRALWDAVGAL